MKYLLLTLLLSGCMTQPTKPFIAKTPQEQQNYNQTKLACRQIAYQYVMSNGLGGNTFVSFVLADQENRCLMEMGY